MQILKMLFPPNFGKQDADFKNAFSPKLWETGCGF